MRKLRWYQVLGFFVVFGGAIAFRFMMTESSREEARAAEQELDELRRRACECRDRGDAACGAEVRDELLAHWEGRSVRVDDANAHLLQSMVSVTEACLNEVGTPSGLRFE